MTKLCAGLFLGLILLPIWGVTQESGDVEAVLSTSRQPVSAVQPDPTPAPSPVRTPSDELNSHLPPWLSFSGEVRLRGTGMIGDFFKSETDSNLLTRLRLNMQVKAGKWMNFYFQGQDAHLIGPSHTASLPALQRDTMDLRLAYLDLGETDGKPVRVRLGRQELAFGEERLIGPANWLNTPRSFDAASATFLVSGLRLDAFAGSVVKIHDGQFNEVTPGNYISGLYGRVPQLIPHATLEPYFFWRRQSGVVTEEDKPGVSNFGTYGFRWVGKFLSTTDYDVEMARQAGSLGPNAIGAWAGHWLFGYSLKGKRLSPRLVGEYNYASGTHDPASGKIGTFNQLFPSAHDLYGLADQVGWQNIRHIRAGIELKPNPNWMVTGKYSSYWLADPHDALYSAAGIAVAKSPGGAAGDYVGQELDFIISRKYKACPALSGGIGHLFPGTFLKITTPGNSYTFPYAAVTYAF